MPVISFDYSDIISLLGRNIPKDELLEMIPTIGADIERVEGDKIDVEFFPNRPDLYCAEGVARAFSAFLGFRSGLREYKIKGCKKERGGHTIKGGSAKMIVDPSVKSVRPYLACAIVRGLNIMDEGEAASSLIPRKNIITIQSLMDYQEKLHLTLGRDRKKISVGIHDIERVEPPFTYKAVGPHGIRFVPLARTEEMDPIEILELHEKGVAYKHLLEGVDKYPIIVDAKGSVLSFPPIINGTLTTVTRETKDVLIDVTGTDMNAVTLMLNIIATTMAERGGQIESMEVIYGKKKLTMPNLSPRHMKLRYDEARAVTGMAFSNKDIERALLRMGFGLNKKKGSAKQAEVLVPAYRADILHEIDLIEDVAIGAGYSKFKGELPKVSTFGQARKEEKTANKIRRILLGMGFHDVATLTLSCERDQLDNFNKNQSGISKISNPISEEHTIARAALTPSLLKILSANKRHDLPQRIFEVGDVVINNRNVKKMAAVHTSSKASFSDAKSSADCVLRNLGVEYTLSPKSHPAFIEGRCASVIMNGAEIGYFGELHPSTVTGFDLAHPVNALEITLEGLAHGKK